MVDDWNGTEGRSLAFLLQLSSFLLDIIPEQVSWPFPNVTLDSFWLRRNITRVGLTLRKAVGLTEINWYFDQQWKTTGK